MNQIPVKGMNFHEQSLPLGDLNIAVKSWGEQAGIPVLALHGWMDNAASFDCIAPLLSGIRLYAVDLPGHGLSSHRAEKAEYYIWSYVEEVLAVADYFELDQFVLLGHSMGGAISCLIAGLFPDRVQQLVMLDTIGPITTRAEKAIEQMRKALGQKRNLKKRVPRIYGSEAEAILARAKKGISQKSASLLATRGVTKSQRGYFWHTDLRLSGLNLLSMTEEQVAALLTEIQCPTLMITSGWNRESSRDNYELRKSYIKHLETVQLSGGHHQHMEGQVGKIASLINQFLGTDLYQR